MLLRFWGVRAALPVPGPGTTEIGGNTACVEVRSSQGALVVIDGGIGLYWLGKSLLAGPHGRGQGETTLLLTRTYWDHIQGFPFFIPAYVPGNKITVCGPAPAAELEKILEGQMRPAYSPIVSLTNMGSKIDFKDIGAPGQKTIEVGGITIKHEIFGAVRGPHAVPTVGYRLEESGKVLTYLSDVEYGGGKIPPEAVRLAKDADLLIHEAFYTTEEQKKGAGGLVGEGFGPAGKREHASFGEAVDLAIRARAKRLLFTHHHPDHDDRAVAAAVESERARAQSKAKDLSIDTAREGHEIEI